MIAEANRPESETPSSRSTTQSRDLTERHARIVLVLLMAVSTLLFSSLAYRKYACFTWETGDSALYGYAFNQTLQGKIFPLFQREGSLLGNNSNFFLFAWLPMFWLMPGMYNLFLFQSIMISLAAWPIYLLARDKTGNRVTALIAATAILLVPAIAGQHVNQIHEDQFGLAFLLFAFYFFESGKFKTFALFLALSLLAKQPIALNGAFFGVYALVRRRDWKWVVFPIGWSSAYLFFILKVWTPMWGNWGKEIYLGGSYFSEYGTSTVGVVEYLVTHPLTVAKVVFSSDRLWYLVKLLQPLLIFLPFGSWAWLLAVPSLGINLLGSNPFFREMNWHYGVIPAGLLYASFVSALPFWSRKLASWFGRFNYSRILCVTTLVFCVLGSDSWFSISQYRKQPPHNSRRKAVQLIPKDTSVFSPVNMLAHFSLHPSINALFELRHHKRNPNELFNYDYMVFDTNYPSDDRQELLGLFEFISKHPDYEAVFSGDGIFVFKRIGNPERSLQWQAINSPS